MDINVFNVSTGVCEFTLVGAGSCSARLAALPDGRLACSTSQNIKVWNVNTGACELTIKVDSCETMIALPDGRLAIAMLDGNIRVWNVRTGECELTLGGNFYTRPRALAVLADGRLASAPEGSIKLWNLRTGACESTISLHGNALTQALTTLSDGRLVVGGHSFNSIQVWNTHTRACELTLEEGYADDLLGLPDGRLASTHSSSRTLRLWNMKLGTLEHVFKCNPGMEFMALLPDGRLASGGGAGITVWDVSPTLTLSYQDVEPILDVLIQRAMEARGISLNVLDLRGIQLGEEGYAKLMTLSQYRSEIGRLVLEETGLNLRQIQTLQGVLTRAGHQHSAEEQARREGGLARQLQNLNQLWSIRPSVDCLQRYHELAAQGYAAATEKLHAIEKASDANSCAVLLEYYQGLFDREPNNREYELKCAKFLFKLSKVSASLDESKLACTEAKMRYFTLFSKNPGNAKIKRGVDKVTAWERDLDNQARAEREQSLASQRKLHEEQSQAGLSRQLANLRASWGRGKPSELLKSYESLAREHSGDIGPLVEMGNYRLHLAPAEHNTELKILSLCKAKELFTQALQLDDYDEAARTGYEQASQLIEEATARTHIVASRHP